jgi:hypothetical protein
MVLVLVVVVAGAAGEIAGVAAAGEVSPEEGGVRLLGGGDRKVEGRIGASALALAASIPFSSLALRASLRPCKNMGAGTKDSVASISETLLPWQDKVSRRRVKHCTRTSSDVGGCNVSFITFGVGANSRQV